MAFVSRISTPALSIAVVGILTVIIRYAAIGPSAVYDLLFSIDYNEVPYDDPHSTDIVFRIRDQKARAFNTGKWRLGAPVPSLFVCRAATGSVHEIPIVVNAPHAPFLDTEILRLYPKGKPIAITELESLKIDNSSIAPNGYTLTGIDTIAGFAGRPAKIDFAKTYIHVELVDTFYPPVAKRLEGESDIKLVQLKDSKYKHCLQQVGNHNWGLIVHFIGWIIPQK